jgi:4-alpha-glucanotransferase
MTDDNERLRGLAEAAGIARTYIDAAGQPREVSSATLRSLLAALGVSDRAAPAPMLDPVAVIEEGQPPALALALPAGDAPSGGTWRLESEDGSRLDGAFRLEDLSVLAADGGTIRRSLMLPTAPALPLGYHRLEVEIGRRSDETMVIVVPRRAYLPEAWAEGRREWAVTAQLYALRSRRNWGIGDFSDLSALARGAAQWGASAIGVNPLHALLAAEPPQISPYSPSSRSLLNPIYIDVTAVPEFSEDPAADDEAGGSAALRASEFVDYPGVWAAKHRALTRLHRIFRRRHLGEQGEPLTERGNAFAGFRRELGAPLERFAIFEALHEHLRAQGNRSGWHDWPHAYRDPTSPSVAAFAAAHRERVEFSQYLQWEADQQLGAASASARGAGMTLGLYRDIAVGASPDGAEAWGDQALLVPGVSVGAPPDAYNSRGQDWGLAPLSPLALKARAFAPFIATLRANMRHAGAVRVDHILGVKRLWWVPWGSAPTDGAYIAYPLNELVGIIALESRRNRCLVIGEDLGTVPEGFRDEMQRRAILSYRLLMFERERGDGDFIKPAAYPELAAAAVSTHDLATLQGFWQSRDLDWRDRLGVYPSAEEAERDRRYRTASREKLTSALRGEGGLSPEAAILLGGAGDTGPDGAAALAIAAHRFLAGARSRLLLVQLEDLLGEVEQVNLPGTLDEHPNWRRKLRLTLEEILSDPAIRRLVQAVEDGRRAASDGDG